MSMDIYAGALEDHPRFGKSWGPVIPFSAWDPEKLADDADAREERGESAFIDNPDYVEDGGMNLADGNARMLFSQLGFDIGEGGFARYPIDEVQKAAMRGLNGAAAHHTEQDQVVNGAQGATIVMCGVPDGYTADKITKLLAIIAKGRPLGATHILVG
jgi:hypothetical protein